MSRNLTHNPLTGYLIGYESRHAMWDLSSSLNECKELASAIGIQVHYQFTQKRSTPHVKTYLGMGKCEEIKQFLLEHPVDIILSDDELTPTQQKFLESYFNIKVLDRTSIILEIFSSHAKTKEAQLQVELAQLEYLRPRLTRLWTHLSRQNGGIGTKGPGEKQLEVDRRHIGKRITFIRKQLEKVEQHRQTNRRKRELNLLPTVAIIGYTNAGKSTLLNTLCNETLLAVNQLFATLDSTTRTLILSPHEKVLITDTVGFIQKLPHQLITSFKSTLEELHHADILLHVVDASSEKVEAMIETTNQIIDALDLSQKDQLLVLNKTDRLTTKALPFTKNINPSIPIVTVSAKTKTGITELKETIASIIRKDYRSMTFKIPYNRTDIVHLLHEHSQVLSESYKDDILIDVEINPIIAEKIMGILHPT